MLKQCRLQELCFGKYRVYLYHDGKEISKEEYWNDAEFDEYLESLEKDGYKQCYTEKEVQEAKAIYDTYSRNVIGGPKEWEFIGQDDNDMPMYKCPVCGRKQFGRSKYCGNCGNRLIWDGDNLNV